VGGAVRDESKKGNEREGGGGGIAGLERRGVVMESWGTRRGGGKSRGGR